MLNASGFRKLSVGFLRKNPLNQSLPASFALALNGCGMLFLTLKSKKKSDKIEKV